MFCSAVAAILVFFASVVTVLVSSWILVFSAVAVGAVVVLVILLWSC